MPLPPAPVFLLGQTLRGRDLLAPVGLVRVAAGERPPGLLLSWDQVHDVGVRDGRQNTGPLTPVFADPGAAKGYNRPQIQRKAAAPWLNGAAPGSAGEWDNVMTQPLDAQALLDVDAEVLPGAVLHQPDWPDGLQQLLDAARRIWRSRGHPDMFVRIAVSDVWLRDVRLRRTLLNQVTDLPEQLGVALHVQWAASGALGDERCIEDLRIVVQAFAGDGRSVLLVEAGALGWLAIAWGAWGFTAGLAQSTWLRSTEQIRRAKGQPVTRVEWYFEPALLHRVRRATHRRLRVRQDYRPCPCSFCAALLPAGGGNWDFDRAAQHALYSIAALTDHVAAPRLVDRHARVRAAVYAAQAYAMTAQLRGEARPTHLSAWLNQL